jgi:hypothetical protein
LLHEDAVARRGLLFSSSSRAAGRSGIAGGENSLALKHSPLRSTATPYGSTILPLNKHQEE